MIVSFKTKNSTVLEKFLKNFQHPTNIFMEMVHNVTFTEKKITRIDDIIVIEEESLLNTFGKYAMLPSVTMIILGMIFSYYWILSTGAILLMLSIIVLSRHFLLLTIMIKLKVSGHKEEIEMISDGFLISKLLMEYNNGTLRNTTVSKK